MVRTAKTKPRGNLGISVYRLKSKKQHDEACRPMLSVIWNIDQKMADLSENDTEFMELLMDRDDMEKDLIEE